MAKWDWNMKSLYPISSKSWEHLPDTPKTAVGERSRICWRVILERSLSIWIGFCNCNGAHFPRQKWSLTKSDSLDSEEESLYILPNTNSKSPKKMDGWKTILSFSGRTYIFQVLLLSVLGSESRCCSLLFQVDPNSWEEVRSFTEKKQKTLQSMMLMVQTSGRSYQCLQVFFCTYQVVIAGFLKNQ